MNFASVNALVIGDVMLDHYITGSAARISQEAPVPIVNKENSWTVPGGASNVARCLARLGCRTSLIGLANHDSAGITLRQELAGEAIEAFLVASKNRPTITKTRIMAAGQQLLRVDEEYIKIPSLEEHVSLKHAADSLAHAANAIILSDYGKGALLRDKTSAGISQHIIQFARKNKIPVLVDPKGRDWDKYAGADCITPNLKEFKEICQSIAPEIEPSNQNLTALAKLIRERFNISTLLLTRGADGMILFEADAPPFRIQAHKREVADVSGAGDTVIATLAACIGSGYSWQESAAIANTAAGIAVGKLGTAPVNIGELNSALGLEEKNSKIFTLPDLQEKIRQWRQNGQKIVFTNGCFDLLHPGHISLLEQSSAFGDKLIVGLNSDDSVKRLKGDQRPVQTQKNRALVLSALTSVDAVIIFDEDTPQALIEKIRPDVLVKGSDYKLENVVGAKFVSSYGGQVRLINLVDQCSTTDLIRHIQGEAPCTK